MNAITKASGLVRDLESRSEIPHQNEVAFYV